MKAILIHIFKFMTLLVGMSLMGILMLPAGALVMLISAIWKTTDKVIACLERWKGYCK